MLKKKLNWHLSCSTPRLCSVQIHKTGLLLHMLMYSKVLLLRYYYLRQSTMRERPDVLYCIYFVSGHLDLQTQLHFFFFMTKTYFLILIKMFSLFVCVLNLQLHFFFLALTEQFIYFLKMYRNSSWQTLQLEHLLYQTTSHLCLVTLHWLLVVYWIKSFLCHWMPEKAFPTNSRNAEYKIRQKSGKTALASSTFLYNMCNHFRTECFLMTDPELLCYVIKSCFSSQF